MKKLIRYFKESYSELVHKVSWTPVKELQSLAITVMVASLIFAVVVLAMDLSRQWYVIRAVGGKEKKVKEYIETMVHNSHLEEYISQVLIPTEKVYTIRNGKKISKEKVSYPGYVLVEAAMVGEIPYVLRNTPNVLGFLGDSKEDSKRMIATPLRPQEVARILGRVDELSQGEEENEIPFFVGETVKVTDGPFSSFSGVIEAVDNDRKKLTVSVKIFGRKTPMELSFMQVEKE